MIQKKIIIRSIMSKTPLFVRRALTKRQISKMLTFMMPEEEVLKCDADAAYKARYLEQHKNNFSKRAASLTRSIDKALERHPGKDGLDESRKELLRKQMEYAFFAYGFYPDEFIFFDLGGANSELDRFRSFVSETERWTFRFAANDFSNGFLADKAAVYSRFSRFYGREALVVKRDDDYEAFKNFVAKHPSFVWKKASSSRGDGVQLVEVSSDTETLFRSIRSEGKALLEERIKQSDELAAFNGSSINTVRVSTYFTRSGVKCVHGFFRMGRNGSFVDNAAKGGIFVVYDVSDGRILTDGFDEYGGLYETHPDTGTPFKGYCFPDWEEATKLCRSVAQELPQMKYVSFDLAHTTTGWVIVEINSSGQYLHQAGQKEGFRKELRALIDDMDLMVPYHLRTYRQTE